jgi:hypothetical protein
MDMDENAKQALFGIIEDEEKEIKKRRIENKETYKVITISLYNDDYELLDNYLKELKSQGYHRINKSKIIRYALRNVNIRNMPKKD